LGDGFYIKDNTGSIVSSLPEWKYEITDRTTLDVKNYSRGKSIFVIRPIA
jgi:hypothetical protein